MPQFCITDQGGAGSTLKFFIVDDDQQAIDVMTLLLKSKATK